MAGWQDDSPSFFDWDTNIKNDKKNNDELNNQPLSIKHEICKILVPYEDTEYIPIDRNINLEELNNKENLYKYIKSFKNYEDLLHEIHVIEQFMMCEISIPKLKDDFSTKAYKEDILRRLTRIFRWLLMAKQTWPNVQPLGLPYER